MNSFEITSELNSRFKKLNIHTSQGGSFFAIKFPNCSHVLVCNIFNKFDPYLAPVYNCHIFLEMSKNIESFRDYYDSKEYYEFQKAIQSML
jgi:hypothetical protein